MIKEKEPKETQGEQIPSQRQISILEIILAQSIPLLEASNETANVSDKDNRMTKEERDEEKSELGTKRRAFQIIDEKDKKEHCMKLIEYLGREYTDPILFLRQWS
jgi:hypothetical protein